MTYSMNADSNQMSSTGLSLQPREIVCPKCQHKRTAGDHGPDWQCPSCGIAYNKATAPSATVTIKVTSGPGADRRQDINDDRWETATPSAIAFSLKGRIGRLRYLAFAWPTIVLSSLLGMLAVYTDPLHKALSMVLVVVVGVLWLWMPLRLMALRVHDLNQSAKWLLALMLLPGLALAIHKPQLAVVFSGFFWVAALLLIVLPGSEGDNDYGPPPGPNTALVTVGAVLFLALIALGVVANIKYRNYLKLHPELSRASATPQGQPGPGKLGPH